MSTATDAVKQTLTQYVAACNAGDPVAYKATLAPDVTLCPPGQTPVSGADAAYNWIKDGFFDPFDITFDASFDRVIETDGEVMAPGTFQLLLRPKAGGDPTHLTGTFFNIFREVTPGSWKYAWLLWNFQQTV